MHIPPAAIIVPCLLFISFVLVQMYYGYKEDKKLMSKGNNYPKAYKPTKKELQDRAEIDFLLDEHEILTYHKN